MVNKQRKYVWIEFSKKEWCWLWFNFISIFFSYLDSRYGCFGYGAVNKFSIPRRIIFFVTLNWSIEGVTKLAIFYTYSHLHFNSIMDCNTQLHKYMVLSNWIEFRNMYISGFTSLSILHIEYEWQDFFNFFLLFSMQIQVYFLTKALSIWDRFMITILFKHDLKS